MNSLLALLLLATAGILLTSCQTPEPAKPVPAARPSGFFNKKYVGIPLDEAINLAEARGVRWRVVETDGVQHPVTKDYRPNRVNFRVRSGFVVEVTRG